MQNAVCGRVLRTNVYNIFVILEHIFLFFFHFGQRELGVDVDALHALDGKGLPVTAGGSSVGPGKRHGAHTDQHGQHKHHL